MTRSSTILLFVFSLFCLILTYSKVLATTITVDTPDDDEVSNGNCTLREAILAANNDTVEDGCAAGSGVDTIVIGVSATILLTNDLPELSESVNILGPGADVLTIDGQDLYELFYFNSSTDDQVFTLNGLTVTRGLNSFGGGIRVGPGENLTLSFVVITANTATIRGGGISIAGSSTDRSILNIYWSTFSDNMADSGGGISAGLNTELNIENSTISSNQSDNNGGGMYILTTDLPNMNNLTTLNRTTVSGNSAVLNGGGLHADASGSVNEVDIMIQNSTFTNNTADSDANNLGSGGGLNLDRGVNVALTNSIFAGNHDLSPSNFFHPDISFGQTSVVVTTSYNFVGINEGASTEFPVGNPNSDRNYVGTEAAPLDPLLNTLQNDGGPPAVHPPLTFPTVSPVIDAGSCPGEPYDQRGYGNRDTGNRIIDYSGASNPYDACDIGAVEARSTPMPFGLQAQAILTGPYVPTPSAFSKTAAPGEMNTALRRLPDFPITQPYNGAPWNHAGTESIGNAPADLVDWVLVHLYQGAPLNPPMTVVATRAGLLMKDGSITDIDGVSALAFEGLETDLYWVVVDHRNHLPAMSLPVGLGTALAAHMYDLTVDGSAWGEAPLQDLGDGAFGLWPGDANADGQVVYIGGSRDQLEVINTLGTSNLAGVEEEYTGADMNMDSQIVYIGGLRDQLEIINTLGTSNLAGVKSSEVPAAN